jgi:ABC-type transporter Mla subunit MlaD
MAASATGITRGMPVKLNGFVVGRVAAIELLPPSTQSDQRVRVALDVFHRYLDYVPKTTRARLAQEGVIGQAVIELVPQRYDARAVRGGEMLPFERSRGLPEIAAGLEARIVPILDNTQVLTQRLADPRGDMQGMLAEGRRAAASVVVTNAEVQATMAQTRTAVAALSTRADATLARSDRTVAAIERDVPLLLGELRATAENARRSSESVAELTARSSEQVPRILDTAEQAASQGNELVSDVRRLWPLSALRREATGTGHAPSDSLDGLDVPLEPVQ